MLSPRKRLTLSLSTLAWTAEESAMTARMPTRLHHTAYVSKDLEKTRAFYEDIIGLPLVATWCEADELFGTVRTYCHCFFGLADGSALAFFQFAHEHDQELFGPPMPKTPFHHIALAVDAETQAKVADRLAQAGYREPDTFVLEHGYCRSLYAHDPNGMIVELTCDAAEAVREDVAAARRESARRELSRWLAGDHRSNNNYR
jgi:catechol 2,3-dioxygenase-like lactoylglutathione lyase family enzyme